MLTTGQPKPLATESDYYLENRDRLIEEYGDKFVAIKGCEVLGAYRTQDEALTAVLKSHELGTFLLRRANESIEPRILHRIVDRAAT